MITSQEHRDQDYLEGYGVGMSHTLSHQELTGHTLAFVRGYRDAVKDRASAWVGTAALERLVRVTKSREGGEPA